MERCSPNIKRFNWIFHEEVVSNVATTNAIKILFPISYATPCTRSVFLNSRQYWLFSGKCTTFLQLTHCFEFQESIYVSARVSTTRPIIRQESFRLIVTEITIYFLSWSSIYDFCDFYSRSITYFTLLRSFTHCMGTTPEFAIAFSYYLLFTIYYMTHYVHLLPRVLFLLAIVRPFWCSSLGWTKL